MLHCILYFVLQEINAQYMDVPEPLLTSAKIETALLPISIAAIVVINYRFNIMLHTAVVLVSDRIVMLAFLKFNPMFLIVF